MHINSAYLYKSIIKATRIGRSIFQHKSSHISHLKTKQTSNQSVHFDSLEIVQGESNNFFKKILGGSYDTACAF